MSSKASVTHPTENIPTNEPPGHGQSQFPFRTERATVIRTSRIDALHQLANQATRSLQGVNAMLAMITHMHPASTLATAPVLNLQNDLGPSQVLGPTTRHNCCLLARSSGRQ